MGIIQRQGIKNSVVNYFGAAIGILSTLFVYDISDEATAAYGLIQYIKASGLLFLPLANWGIQNLTVRYFPVFKTEDRKHHGFLSFLFVAASLAYLVFALLAFVFWDQIFAYLQSQREEMEEGVRYLWYFIPLTYLLVLVNMLTNYISNFQRIVIPAIVHDLFLKLVLPALILLFAYGFLSLEWIVRIFLLAYVVIVIFLLLYLHRLEELHLHRPQAKIWEHLRPMADFAGFSMLGSLGGVLALQLDLFMMGNMSDLFDTGVYGMAITITMVITIPQRSIMNITAPIIADRWQNRDTDPIQTIYQQTSLLLLIAGLFLLIEVAVNFPDLCSFVDNETLLGAYIPVLILGAGRIVDMGTSVNGHIIQYSERYRVNVYFIVFLGAVNILLNLLLIPRFGMAGAASATAFSLIAYNVLRTIYVQYRFNMLPFTWSTLWVLLIAGLAVAIGFLLPTTSYPLLNLIYRGAAVAVCFLVPVYYWKLSPQFNDAVKRILGGKFGS
ncbi:lipopolysaccharide biosynthesis protein [Flavilitoribacter nigricans]|uniref:Uncharacterized protein n=1 Tax=Flavilitoribacter nigricans (strain ATCC 23147 / DSM 23189 / NBRC 102662 / NCIMB 1420 / SS-2) TaxID=1122177 RepID=A0A2D0NGF1_FLAN2|nr:polysaccharide biosynthesis C-terminal domain-containing protein [Flavilitoribacter nigricans]PHN07565.1 hypothetical protein CRP01_05545 [Flavilitoribacter nigricans DSM 23189 = NBRC 102662]